MKKVTLFLLTAACFICGCATASREMKALPHPAEPATKEAILSASFECLNIAEQTRKNNNAALEKAALELAYKYLKEISSDNRNILSQSSDGIKNIIAISGFEFAPKESLGLLMLYMEMQNAYADYDNAALNSLKAEFDEKLESAKTATALAKQNRIDSLGKELSAKRDEIKRSVEADITLTALVSYVVKKGDTLPNISAKREVYNDSFMWPLIYKANRDQIKDPQTLHGGQELKIPRDMSLEDIIQARKDAGAPEPDKIPKDATIPRRTK